MDAAPHRPLPPPDDQDDGSVTEAFRSDRVAPTTSYDGAPAGRIPSRHPGKWLSAQRKRLGPDRPWPLHRWRDAPVSLVGAARPTRRTTRQSDRTGSAPPECLPSPWSATLGSARVPPPRIWPLGRHGASNLSYIPHSQPNEPHSVLDNPTPRRRRTIRKYRPSAATSVRVDYGVETHRPAVARAMRNAEQGARRVTPPDRGAR
jgi:hypothetical protein